MNWKISFNPYRAIVTVALIFVAVPAHTVFSQANVGQQKTPLSYDIQPILYRAPITGAESPFFPIGWYSFGPLGEKQILEVYENGCNTVLFSGLGNHDWQKTDALARLDQALMLNMKIVIGWNRTMVGSVKYTDPKTHGRIPDYVRSLKDHPALLGWMLGDEMPGGSAQAIHDTIRLIRDNRSNHQVWQVHSHIESDDDLQALMAQTDVCSFDGYTYLHDRSTFADVCSTRILAWQQAKANLAQTGNWAGNVNVTQAVGCKCGNADFRFPSYDEYRWNVFSAIASAGARGTLNWIYSYWGGFYNDDPKPFFEFRDTIVKPVNLEQRMIAHAMETGYNVGQVVSNLDELTNADIPPAKGGHRKFNKIGHILLYDNQQQRYFLIVTNNESSAHIVRLTIADLPVPLRTLTVDKPHDNRQLTLDDLGQGRYQLQDQLDNHDVAVYVIQSQ